MNLSIREFAEVSAEEWDSFQSSQSMGSAHFLYDLVAQDWRRESENLSFVIDDEVSGRKNIVLAFQLNLAYLPVTFQSHTIRGLARYLVAVVKRLTRRESGYILFSHFGYVLRDGLSNRQIRQIKERMQEKLDGLVKKYRCWNFELEFSPLSKALGPNSLQLVNPCIFMGFAPTVRYTYMVDLSKNDDRMLSDCDETTRQAIRKIGREGRYEVVECMGSKEEYDCYLAMHRETYARTGGTPKPESYHRLIFDNLVKRGICKIFWLRDRETGENIADLTVLISHNIAYYYWGCSLNDHIVGANKFLLFTVMMKIREQFKSQGVSGFFETGGGKPYARDGKSKGLNDYKKSFGSFLHPIYGGRYE